MAVNEYTPRLKDQYDGEDPSSAEGRPRAEVDHAGAAAHEDHAQHGLGEAKNDAKQLDKAVEEI